MPLGAAPIDAAFRRWWPSAALALAAISIELGGERLRLALRFDRAQLMDGEPWRLITGSLAHLGPRHLLLNLMGLGLIAALGHRSVSGTRGACVAMGAAVGVGLGLLMFSPEVAWYVGLSGVLHGLLAAFALELALDRATRRWGVALAVLLAAKLAWEQFVGAFAHSAVAAGGPVIVDAHLYGALAGAATVATFVWHERRRAGGSSQV